MVERLQRRGSPHSPLAVEPPEVLLTFGIEAKPRVAGRFEAFGQPSDLFELGVAIGVPTAGDRLSDLTPSDAHLPQPCGNRVGTDRRAEFGQGVRKIPRRHIGVDDVRVIGIAGGANL